MMRIQYEPYKKLGFQNFLTGSLLKIRPVRIDKLRGLRCKTALTDEWLSDCINEDVMGPIEQGTSKRGSI